MHFKTGVIQVNDYRLTRCGCSGDCYYSFEDTVRAAYAQLRFYTKGNEYHWFSADSDDVYICPL